MELIRKIMLAVEQHEHGRASRELHIGGYSAEQIGYHSYLLGDAGLAVTHDIGTSHDAGPMAKITRLTWQGHEFLDVAKDDTIWNKSKDRLAAAGQSLLTVPISVLTALLIDEAKKRLGLC